MKDMKVVVIGGVHHNTLGVIRSLGEEKISKKCITVLIIGKKIIEKNIISTCKYISKSKIIYLETYQEITPWLLSNPESEKACIICCSDGASEQVMANYNILKKQYYCPSTRISIEQLMLKEVQGTIAKKAGFNVPENAVIGKTSVGEWSIFPCITKPIKSVIGGGKSDIHISHSRKELESALIGTDSEFVQIQRYIDKKIEYQLIGCSLSGGEIIIIPGFTDIIRQPDNTNTGYLKYSPIDKLNYDKLAVERFIKEIGYSGLFSLEFIRGKDNKDYFLEINMRNDGNAYCVKSAGVNLPYIWCYYQYFNDLPNVRMSIDSSVYFMPEFSDIKRGIKEVGLLKWLRQLFRAESHAIYNSKDIIPFAYKVYDTIKSIIFKQ